MKRIEAGGGKKWREWCLLFFFGVVTLLCFANAVRSAEFVKLQMSELEFVSPGQKGALDYAGARSVWEENQKREHPLEYVNWTQTDGVQVSAPGLGTAEECSALFLCGRSDLLFPGYAVLDVESRYGCLLSSALSGKLFGGKDTKGLTVEAQGRTLKVLDVIESREVFLVCEAGENDPCNFDRAAVSCRSGEIGKTEESYQQLCGGWKRMESRVLVWVTQSACFLIPCILWIYLAYYCAEMLWTARRSERADRMEKIIWTFLLYLVLAGGILVLIRGVQIPEDMIPTKWSDFEFWTEYGKKLGASCRLLIWSEKKIPDFPIWKEFARTLRWAAGAAAGEAVFLRGFWRMQWSKKS